MIDRNANFDDLVKKLVDSMALQIPAIERSMPDWISEPVGGVPMKKLAVSGMGEVPIGGVFELPSDVSENSLPGYFCPCDGRTLSSSGYDRLFGIIGFHFGQSGVNMLLPDYRPRKFFIRIY